MFRKELLVFGLLAAGVFLLVAGVSSWLTRILAHEARMLVADTLPGLINAGEALNVMDSNWEKMLGLTALASADTRSNVIRQIQLRTTTEFWSRYQESIFDPRDQQLFFTAQTARTNSRVLATQFFELVNAQRLAEADQLLQDRLKPAFEEYRGDAMKLFQLNKEVGNRRSERILTVSRWLPLLAGGFSVLLFGLGFLLGLRGAFTGVELVFGRERKQPAETGGRATER